MKQFDGAENFNSRSRRAASARSPPAPRAHTLLLLSPFSGEEDVFIFPFLPQAHSLPTPMASAEPQAARARAQLRIFFVPLASPGHLLPMFDIARLFSTQGAESTLILTPSTTSLLRPFASRSGPSLHLHSLPFPSPSLTGLPPGVETADALPSRELCERFVLATALLADPFLQLARADPPDAIVADACLPWTLVAAAELGVPHYTFPGTGCFAQSLELGLLLHRPQDNATSLDDMFIVPGLPHKVHVSKAQIRETLLPGSNTKDFFDKARHAEQNTDGYVVNTFNAMEPGYIEHYGRMTGKTIWALGPVSLANQTSLDTAERGAAGTSGNPEAAKIITWLDKRAPGSVLYVCFGSLSRLPLAQIKEIGLGLEESGVSFFWVVGNIADEAKEAAEWVAALEKRVQDRGLVLRGRAPQLLVLSHAAVGGFLTHCGWGSTVEAAAAGVPTLTWPLFAEQFYNEKLLVEVLGVGVSVGALKGFVWGEEEKAGVVVGRERIAEKVAWLLGSNGGEEAKDVRRRARELAEKARRATKVGGDSYTSVGLLMQEIERRRARRRAKGTSTHG